MTYVVNFQMKMILLCFSIFDGINVDDITNRAKLRLFERSIDRLTRENL